MSAKSKGAEAPTKCTPTSQHPINQACRDLIQNSVIREYLVELDRAKQPDYKSRYDDEYIDASHSDVPVNQNQSPVETSAVPKPHFLDAAEKKSNANPQNAQDKRNFGDGIF